MATPPEERDKTMMRNGVRLLVLGLVLIVVGIAVAIPLSGTAAGIGWAIAGLGCVPGMAGLALCGSAIISRRSRAGRPFA
jgi:hypothetical protein